MTTRKIVIHDLREVALLFDKYRLFYGKEPSIEGAEKILMDRFQNKESEIFVTEIANKKLIGFVQLYPLFSSTRMKLVLNVFTILIPFTISKINRKFTDCLNVGTR